VSAASGIKDLNLIVTEYVLVYFIRIMEFLAKIQQS